MGKRQNKAIRRRIAGSYVSSLISMSLVLLLVGACALFVMSIPAIERQVTDNLHITLLLKDRTPAVDALSLKSKIAGDPSVRDVRYVSVQEGEAELKEIFGEDFLGVFDSSPVPSSLEVGVVPSCANPDSLRAIGARLLKLSPIVEEVDYPDVLAGNVSSALRNGILVSLAVAALLLFISVILISSTLRLSLYAKRFTIHTMLLVGASRSYIAGPYVRRCVLEGLIASLISFALAALVLLPLMREYPQMKELFTLESLVIAAIAVVVFAVIVCALCGRAVLRKILKLDNEQLYG